MTSSSSSARTSPSTPPPPSIFQGTAGVQLGIGGGTALKRTGSLFRDPFARNNKPRAHEPIAVDDAVRNNLGSDYHDIQKRTLTQWVNQQLSTVDDRIEGIDTGFRDGKRLLKLLSVVSGQPAPKPERMSMRIHQLSNVAQALGFLEKQVGDALPDIGNEAIVNGDVKKTLALIFFIMIKYQLGVILNDHGDTTYMDSIALLSDRQEQGEIPATPSRNLNPSQCGDARMGERDDAAAALTPLPSRKQHHHHPTQADKTHGNDAKMALMYWVRIQLEDYIAADVIPSVQDFSRSWRTGVAFCLLLHRHDPMLIPDMLSTHLKADLTAKETWHHLLAMAFDVAQQQLAIPRYLEPEDLLDVEYPYEPSVMVYVSEYYKVMSKTQRADSDAARREKAAQRRRAIARAIGGGEEQDSCDYPAPPTPTSSPPPISPLEEKGQQPHDTDAAVAGDKPIQATEPRTPLEAPVPVAIPSYARRRKGHQRESTLAEQDKARIKADLNSRLMMQLTGHLPRGVHPVLDKLLTIHETVSSFIKNNTRTIDEIPEEFVGSESVQEYMEALEIIEQQAAGEAPYLETAREAHDQLLLGASPAHDAAAGDDNDNDDDESMIRLTELQCTQVGRLYDTLLRDWKDFEELLHNTKVDMLRVESELVGTEQGIREYTRQAGLTHSRLEALFDALVAVPHQHHPLDGDADAVLQSYNQAMGRAASDIQAFETTAWRTYRAMMRDLSPSVRQAIGSRHAALQQRYEQLEPAHKNSKQQCSLFRRGVALAKSLAALDDTLAAIDVAHDDDNVLVELETRVSMVRSKLNALREEYIDLLESTTTNPYQARFAERIHALHGRCASACEAIEQVQRWLIEAKRIREWIEARITLVQSHAPADPLCMDFDAAAQAQFPQHDQLKREVDRFEADDIARLRARLDELKRLEKPEPANATVIALLQELLDMYQRLLHLLQNADLAIRRATWERITSGGASDSIDTARHELDRFLTADGKARWTLGSDKSTTSEATATLTRLQTCVADIERKTLAEATKVFQAMEAMHGEPLPDHMEQRRAALANSFQAVSQRLQFARKVVIDQHLPAVDVLSRLRNLANNATAEKDARQFKADAALALQDAATRIAFPDDEPWMSDAQAQRNQQCNSALRDTVRGYTEQLTQASEKMLNDQVPLQERVDLLLEDACTMAAWLEQCTRRRGSWKAVASQLEQTNGYEQLMGRARRLEEEIDDTNAVSVDRTALIDALERLQSSHEQFQHFATERQQASNQWEEVVLPVAQELWSFVTKATFDSSRLGDTGHVYREELQGLEALVTGVMLEERGELETLFQYASAILEQRESILFWLKKTDQLVGQGKSVCNRLEENSDSADSHVIGFKRAVNDLTFPDKQPQEAEDHWEFGIHEHHTRSQREITAFIEQKRRELSDVTAAVDRLYSAHQSSDKLKQLVELYDTEVTELRDWVAKHTEQLRQSQVDAFADLSESQLLERQQKHASFVADIELFEKSNVNTLQDNIAQLENGGLQRRLDEVLLDLEELKAMMGGQSDMFCAALKRADWESQITAATSRLKNMIQQVGKQRDAEHTADTIEQWHEQLRTVEDEKQAFAEQELADIDTAYKAFGHALGQCHRSSTSIPVHMEARMDSLFRMKRRLSETLQQQLRHANQAKQRMGWQQAVDHVLDQLAQHEQLVDTFVQDKARWMPERDTDSHDQPLLEQHHRELVDEIQQFRQAYVSSLLEQDNSDDASMDRRRRLQKADSRLVKHMTAAGDIVTQHGMIAAFISQTTQLEGVANAIREELLKDHRVAGVQERLYRLRADVSDICRAAADMQYPVRDADHFKIQDESINEVIRDMVATRTRRLDELAASLEQQRESKELMTRYQVQLRLYKKHSEAVQAWMQERNAMLDTYKGTLETASKAPLGMGDLQQAISALTGLERAMKKTRDNIFTSLQSLFEQCAAAFDDAAGREDNDDASLNEFDAIEATQHDIDTTWHRLRDETSHLGAALSVVLEPTERYHRSAKLVASLTELQQAVDDADAALVSDESISQWQKKVNHLDSNVYSDLNMNLSRAQARSGRSDNSREAQMAVQATQSQLDTAGELIVTIRSKLTALYDTVNMNRLRKTYSDNAAVAVNMMMRTQDLFKDTCEQFSTVTAQDRVAQRHALIVAHKDAQRRWAECRDAYDDLSGYHQFIHGQEEISEEMKMLHVSVQEEWMTLQKHQDDLASLVERVDGWVERYDIVDQLQRGLSIIQRDMEERRKNTSYSSSTTSSSIKSRNSSDSEGNMLTALEKRLNSVERDLQELLDEANEGKECDRANSVAFVEYSQEVSTHISSLRSVLSQRRVELDKANLLAAFGDEIKRHSSACEEQINALKQQSTSNPSIAEKKPAAIQTVIGTYTSTLSMARRVHSRARDSLAKGTLAEQAHALVQTFHVLNSEADRMKRPLERLLSDLDQRTNVEHAYVGILESVCNHAQAEGEMLASLSEFKETVARFARSARIARTKGALLPNLAEFERRYSAMETAVQDFLGMGGKIKAGFHRIHGMTTRIASVNRSMDRRQDTIKREWARIRVSAEETKAKLQDTQMRQHASAKLAEAIRFVGELKHRTLRLEGKSMAEEQQEFKEIQSAIADGLAKRLEDADQIVASVVDKDGRFKRQRQELTSLVHELEALVRERQEQAEMEGNMVLFTDTLDKMHDQMTRMTRLVRECSAPESAPGLANNRISKGDLQGLLRKLLHGRKDIEGRMAELAENARSEARKQFMDNTVASRLDTTLEEWAQVQAKATAGEKELQSAIRHLDQEFFTKLSMAKSTSPGGRPARHLTPTPPPPPPLDSNNNRKPRRQSVHHPMNRRRTPTPSASRRYVADPKNELDVQLGRIINESPVQMKIKRVAGEVGKYWFGDEHPRLVYCRILPSKAVMVRVGGGWQDLPNYLKSQKTNQPPRAASKGDASSKPPSSPDHTKLQTPPPPLPIQPSKNRSYIDGSKNKQGKQ